MTDWKKLCKNCGECCGPVPFDIMRYQLLKGKIQTQPTNEIYDIFPGMILPLTESDNCVFLKKNKRCAIYQQRPIVCRLFGIIPELKCFKQGN